MPEIPNAPPQPVSKSPLAVFPVPAANDARPRSLSSELKSAPPKKSTVIFTFSSSFFSPFVCCVFRVLSL